MYKYIYINKYKYIYISKFHVDQNSTTTTAHVGIPKRKSQKRHQQMNVFPRSLPQAFQTRRPLIASVDPTFTVGLPFCEIPKVGVLRPPFFGNLSNLNIQVTKKKTMKIVFRNRFHHPIIMFIWMNWINQFEVWELSGPTWSVLKMTTLSWKAAGKKLEALWHQLGGGEKKSSDAARSSFQIDVENHPWP